jgi:hypothetical protein
MTACWLGLSSNFRMIVSNVSGTVVTSDGIRALTTPLRAAE